MPTDEDHKLIAQTAEDMLYIGGQQKPLDLMRRQSNYKWDVFDC
jgi:hypothetical protein